ncbi:MAG: Mth938-like domain-containing protein [Reyranellaceae bacterium]
MIDDKTLPTPRPEDRQVIQSYGPGRFRISNVTYEHAVLVLPERTLRWAVSDSDPLAIAPLAPLREAGEVNILLIGGGGRALPVPQDLRLWLRQAGIVADAMDTGAACRTYGVLLAEGRRVAAALLPVP